MMNMHVIVFRIIVILLFTFSSFRSVKAQTVIDTIGNTVVEISIVLDSSHFKGGISSGPWDLYWGPDQKLWYTNRNMLNTYDPSTQIIDTILQIPSGYIMGVTTHDNFFANPYVYLTVDTADYYGGGHIIELFRYDYSLAGDSLYNPQYILEWYHAGEHSGGRLVYGADDKVYVSTAEYWVQFDTLFSNSGKVLRINPDGTVPIDNPRADYTFSYGHRNPQGIVQVPNGNIFVSEYGMQWDELNLIEENGFYGWVVYDGITCFNNSDSCDYFDTTAVFPIDVGINPPSGIDYYNHTAIPEFNGLVQAVTGSIKQGIIVYTMNAAYDSVLVKSYYLTQEYDRVRDVCVAPDGSVYFIARDRNKPDIRVIKNPLVTGSAVLNNNSAFSIYPNPTSDEITFVKDSEDDAVIYIQDLSGRTLFSKPISGKGGKIDVSKIAVGSYFVTLQSMDEKISRIIIKVD